MRRAKHSVRSEKERSAKRLSDGSAALKSEAQKRSNFDVVSKSSFIPFAWQRKTGRASSLFESFYHAFHGVFVGLKGQRNLKIHFLAAVFVVVLGLTLKIEMAAWLSLIVVMGLVISLEYINTALEHLVDISADGQYRYAARCAKDTAAAAVLVASLTALATGSVVFVPRLIQLLGS
ncbi:MAG: diacylglycerol kinase family protein [Candidatus Obscuribacterales bacterium]|nr:diacylglycerol kinase family protein [Candidatus Obscuribacterales bacterium]